MMMKNQRVVMACVSSIIAMIIMLFYDTIYADRLIEIGVSKNLVGNYFSPSQLFIGYIMALACLSYTISTPIVGWLSKKIKKIYVTQLSFAVAAVSLLMFGPSHYLDFP